MALADFLTQSARLERRTPVRSGYGDATPSWALVAGKAAVPCLLRPLKAEVVARQGRDLGKTWIRAYFDEDHGLTRDHRLVVEGRYLAVQGSVDFNEMGRLIAVDCVEVTA